MAETIESKRRSRIVRIGSTLGVVVAAGLVVWGFSRGNDDRSPTPGTAPGTAPATSPGLIINGPAEVQTTQPVGAPSGTTHTTPGTADVPVFPPGTADVAFPPVSSDIPAP